MAEIMVKVTCSACGTVVSGRLDQTFRNATMQEGVSRCPACGVLYNLRGGRRASPPPIAVAYTDEPQPQIPTLAELEEIVDAAVEKRFDEFVFAGTTETKGKKAKEKKGK